MARRNTLCLDNKMKLIKYFKENPSTGSRKLAEIFGCGRTQIQLILKSKETIKIQYEMHTPANRKRKQEAKYKSIDDAVFEWYSLV